MSLGEHSTGDRGQATSVNTAAVHFFAPLMHEDVTQGLHHLCPISSTSNAPGSSVHHFKKLCCKTFQSWCCIWKRCRSLGERISKRNSCSKEKGRGGAWESLLELAFFEIICPCEHYMLCLLSPSSHSPGRRHAVG